MCCSRENRPLLSCVLSIIQVVLVAIMMFAAIYKIATYGLVSFVIHLTNWSWLAQTVFYAATTLIPLPEGTSFVSAVICICYAPLLALTTGILIAVSMLFWTEDEFVDQLTDEVSPGVIVVASDVFHAFPVILIFSWSAFHFSSIVYAFRIYASESCSLGSEACCGSWAYRETSCWRNCWIALFVLYELWGGLFVFLIAYSLAVDPQEVYSAKDIGYGEGFAVFTLVAIGLVGVLLVMLFCCYDAAEKYSVDEEDYARARTRLTDSELRVLYKLQLARDVAAVAKSSAALAPSVSPKEKEYTFTLRNSKRSLLPPASGRYPR